MYIFLKADNQPSKKQEKLPLVLSPLHVSNHIFIFFPYPLFLLLSLCFCNTNSLFLSLNTSLFYFFPLFHPLLTFWLWAIFNSFFSSIWHQVANVLLNSLFHCALFTCLNYCGHALSSQTELCLELTIISMTY